MILLLSAMHAGAGLAHQPQAMTEGFWTYVSQRARVRDVCMRDIHISVGLTAALEARERGRALQHSKPARFDRSVRPWQPDCEDRRLAGLVIVGVKAARDLNIVRTNTCRHKQTQAISHQQKQTQPTYQRSRNHKQSQRYLCRLLDLQAVVDVKTSGRARGHDP